MAKGGKNGKGKLTIELTDIIYDVERAINKAIAKKVNKLAAKNVQRLERLIKATAKVWLRSQPEIQSLIANGVPDSLNAQFGLSGQALAAVDVIIESVLATVNINIPPFKDNLKGQITFTIQPTDFNNLLQLPQGHNIQYAKSDLHWLDWLLLKGDSAIIIGYHYNAEFGRGRSGGGFMDGGGVWRVPPQFSGTAQDNFVTRAFENREKELARMLQGLLEE